MDISNKTVLVLGGYGLVGNALIRKLVPEKPKQIIVTSLLKSEAEEACKKLYEEFPNVEEGFFEPWWGDIFVRDEFKEINRNDLLNDEKKRKILMSDIMDELNSEILHSSSIYKLLTKYKPNIIIDAINSATAI